MDRELIAQELSYDKLTEVLKGRLWQSGSRLPADCMSLFDTIVTFGDEMQPWKAEWWESRYERVREGEPRLLMALHIPLIDSEGWLDAPTASVTAQYIATLLKTGRKILIHCDGGVFRSVFMTALVVSLVEDIPGTNALAFVQKARGRMHRKRIGFTDYDQMLSLWPVVKP